MNQIRIDQFQVVFWDFDGVIKDSIEVKADAYEALFLPFGGGVAAQVRAHHEANGGVSRFDKIPLYLGWTGMQISDDLVVAFSNKFSELVMQKVIDSPWVPGVHDYLLKWAEYQYFVLVTATPHDEILQIMNKLDITHCFREVYGAPKSKSEAILSVLQNLDVEKEKILLIGDSETDRLVALEYSIPFLLRCTNFNRELQTMHTGLIFEDMKSYE